MSKHQVIESSIANADSWEEKGQSAWVCKCLSTALMNYLSLAVENHEHPKSACSWLLEQEVDVILLRHMNALADVSKNVDQGNVPESILGGNYHHLVFTHLSVLLGDFDTADRFLQIADRIGVRTMSTPFWQEYCNALLNLRNSTAYVPKVPRVLKDLEKYWVEYLHFVSQITIGMPPLSAATTIDRAFEMRNTDPTIKDDHYEVEGSGRHPVRWDFRRESLIRFVERVKAT